MIEKVNISQALNSLSVKDDADFFYGETSSEPVKIKKSDLNLQMNKANLNYCIKSMQKTFDNPFIIAIDASLGKEDHIGMMTLGSGPLKPGLGVKKKLPEVGDLHITGIVNSSHDMESSTLQTTRLSIIFQIADAIVLALRTFNDDYYIQQEPELSYLLSQTS